MKLSVAKLPRGIHGIRYTAAIWTDCLILFNGAYPTANIYII